MAAISYLVPINLNKNEIQNGVFQVLATAPGSPVEGQFYYDSVDKVLYFHNGTGWVAASMSAASILSALLTVDGTGTGLDADLLDGEHGSHYLDRTNHTGTQAASTISDLASVVQAYSLDLFAAAAAAVDMGGFKVTNLENGTASGDAVNYGQLMASVNGLRWLAPVRAKTTGNITLSGEQTIDGVACVTGDRVAVLSQTTTTQDGIYLVSSGGWTRTTDFAVGQDMASASFFVQEGSTNADTQWSITNNLGGGVVGTDNLAPQQVGAGTSYTADGSTLSLSGTTFSIHASYVGQSSITTLGTITTGTWQGTAVAVAYGGTGATTAAGARTNLGAVGKYTATLGNGSSTSFAITQGTHGLASVGSMVAQVFDATSGAMVICDITINNSNGTVTFVFAVAPTTNQYRYVIMG